MAYDNLAYAYPEEYEVRVEEKRHKIKQEKKQAIKKQRVMIVCYVVMMLLAAVFMISKNVSQYEGKLEIKALEKELAQIESYTSQKTFEMEENIDLNTIEEIAATKLGMQRPSKSQTVYVNIKRDDVCELTSKEVEGVKNRITDTVTDIKDNVVGVLSIR